MSAAGGLDVERYGVNADAVKTYGYTGGNLTTEVATYDDGTTIKTWTKTYGYDGSDNLTSESKWVLVESPSA